MLFGVVLLRGLSSTAPDALTTRSACHSSLASCLSSLGESLPFVPDAYDQSLEALSSQPTVSGSESHVPGAGGFEARNEPPDSILSHEPKPLRKHRPPPPQFVWSPDELSYPP
ncbi:hypothetical protein Tco_1046722 [Tanacetum coccineum]